jgi:membrane-associated phospholipid phosphatase
MSFERSGDRAVIVDDTVTSFARRNWGSRLDPVAIAVSHLGRGGLLWLLTDAALEARTSRRPLPTGGVARAIAVSYGSSLLLARLLRRQRPCHRGGGALVECPDGPGLPSDQTAAAFAAAHAIRSRHPHLAAPLYTAATAIALARVYCGVHHLTDTIVGAAFGIATAAAIGGEAGLSTRGRSDYRPAGIGGLASATGRDGRWR